MQMQLLGGGIAFLAAVIGGIVLIPILRKLKFGQEIREEGPKWHKAKSGTPTMGGIIFIAAMIVAFVLCWLVSDIIPNGYDGFGEGVLLLVVSLAFGAVGFLDDYIKVILKRNLGLTAKQKFGLQFLVALAFALWIAYQTMWERKLISRLPAIHWSLVGCISPLLYLLFWPLSTVSI